MDTLDEVQTPRQHPGEPRRRWFTSDALDLIVWYDPTGRPTGFQFCYGKPLAEHALTWRADQGFTHTGVDDGENVGLAFKRTPILVPDGALDIRRIVRLFQDASARLPADVTAFVMEALTGHPAHRAGT
jgi:hypothetical protein